MWAADSRNFMHLARFNAGGYDGYEISQAYNFYPQWFGVAYNPVGDRLLCYVSQDGKEWINYEDIWINNVLAANGVGAGWVGPAIRTEGYPIPLAMSVQNWEVGLGLLT
jgi:hypothetical protein